MCIVVCYKSIILHITQINYSISILEKKIKNACYATFPDLPTYLKKFLNMKLNVKKSY